MLSNYFEKIILSVSWPTSVFLFLYSFDEGVGGGSVPEHRTFQQNVPASSSELRLYYVGYNFALNFKRNINMGYKH